MESTYIINAVKQLQSYKSIAEKTFDQLSEEQLFWQYNETSNSIAIIIKHMHGNMVSRWTDFLTTDGEKEWRNREAEFENDIQTKEELLQQWNTGWEVFFSAITPLQDSDLEKTVYIRNQAHTVMEAIARQVAHYPYHIGQIVYIAKMIVDTDWKSLSIPKGGTKAYNAKMFSKHKS